VCNAYKIKKGGIMKVKELIKELENFNGEDVVCRVDSENGDQTITKVIEKKAIDPDIPYVCVE
jgi:hypothetical protein